MSLFIIVEEILEKKPELKLTFEDGDMDQSRKVEWVIAHIYEQRKIRITKSVIERVLLKCSGIQEPSYEPIEAIGEDEDEKLCNAARLIFGQDDPIKKKHIYKK